MLAALFDLVLEIAVFVAATGVAWWCWDQYRTSTERRDEAARLSLTAERQSADLRHLAEKLDERITAISSHLAELGQAAHLAQSAQSAQSSLLAEARTKAARDENARLAAMARDEDTWMAAKVRVHRLLHSTTDPFLTFVEIERALDNVGRLADRAPPEEHGADGEDPPLAGNRLRRVLIELVSDGVVAQLDRDRYFIASDYETGVGDDENGDGEDAV